MIGSCRARSYIIAICMVVMLFTCMIQPATGYLIKNQYYLQTYTFGLYTVPVLWDGTSNNRLVTLLDQGTNIVTYPGENITVTLMETDPNQNWELMDAGGAHNTGNDVLVTYPVEHQFYLKTIYSCPVSFRMTDDRSGQIVKTFNFYMVVAGPVSGIGWPAFSSDCAPSFVWPVRPKF